MKRQDYYLSYIYSGRSFYCFTVALDCNFLEFPLEKIAKITNSQQGNEDNFGTKNEIKLQKQRLLQANMDRAVLLFRKNTATKSNIIV